MLRLASGFITLYRQHETRRRIAHVANSVEQHALMYGSLPYPAMDLEGNQCEKYQTAQELIDNPCKKNRGYIPYRTLGIDKRYAYDANGRPLQYYASVCMLKIAEIPSTPFLERAIRTKSNSLLLAFIKNEHNYDVDFIGEKAYLSIDCDQYIVGIISKVPSFNIIKEQMPYQYNLTNIPAFAITDNNTGFNENEASNVVKRTSNMLWISRFELGLKIKNT